MSIQLCVVCGKATYVCLPGVGPTCAALSCSNVVAFNIACVYVTIRYLYALCVCMCRGLLMCQEAALEAALPGEEPGEEDAEDSLCYCYCELCLYILC